MTNTYFTDSEPWIEAGRSATFLCASLLASAHLHHDPSFHSKCAGLVAALHCSPTDTFGYPI